MHWQKKKVFVWTSVQDIIRQIQQQKDKTKRQQLQKCNQVLEYLKILYRLTTKTT